MQNPLWLFTLILIMASQHTFADAPATPGNDAKYLQAIVEKYHLPGIVAGLVEDNRLTWVGAAGVRKMDSPEPITTTDQMHLGSDTKAMTGLLIAQLVEKKQLSWENTLAEIYPDLALSMNPVMAKVTVRNLLTHTAGLPHDVSWGIYALLPIDLPKQRRDVLEAVVKSKPESIPGSKYAYSNIGFVLLGAILEQKTGKSWESLIEEKIFKPLNMTSAGFGPPGEKDKVEEPWGHIPGKLTPLWSDNPALINPAGRVHCSLADWAAFVSLFVRNDETAVITRKTLDDLTEPLKDQEYAAGWGITTRPWAGGKVLTHAGSNGMWYCVVWAAPLKHFAVITATNVGGDDAAKACDAAVSELIVRREKR